MKLPLLQFVASQYPVGSLDNVAIVACQHILPTTLDLFEELFEQGIQPQNVFIIGKCYSTNAETFKRFQKTGVSISDTSSVFDSHTSFDEQFEKNIEEFFKKIQLSINFNSFKKVIILDDGGHLITFVNRFVKDTSHFVAIEQTSSGYRKIKSMELKFSVINVARSRTKLEMESPFIAKAVVQKIEVSLEKYTVKNPKILIIGMGSIGQEISILLKKKYSVFGYDSIRKKSDFDIDYKHRIGEFDVIIGTTGTSVIHPSEFSLLKKGVLLASASSSDREFSAVYLRQLTPKTENCHDDIQVNGVVLLNCGFPMNFSNGQENESRDNIQITRALLLAGIFEAVTKIFPIGLVDLNVSIQNRIIEQFRLFTMKDNK